MTPDVDPLVLVATWLSEAERDSGRRNPLAMAVGTSSPEGRPSVRMVLLRGFVRDPGFVVFYTHYGSRKGRELDGNARAAATLYWEELGRQLRLEGPVTRSPADESDRYFARRPRMSQLNAWVSAQSQPIDDPARLASESLRKARELGVDDGSIELPASRRVPRPGHWGGFRIWLDSIEFWSEGDNRFHERVWYGRALVPDEHSGGFQGSAWSHAFLQP